MDDLTPVAEKSIEFLRKTAGYVGGRLTFIRNIGRIFKIGWEDWFHAQGHLYLDVSNLEIVGFEVEEKDCLYIQGLKK